MPQSDHLRKPSINHTLDARLGIFKALVAKPYTAREKRFRWISWIEWWILTMPKVIELSTPRKSASTCSSSRWYFCVPEGETCFWWAWEQGIRLNVNDKQGNDFSWALSFPSLLRFESLGVFISVCKDKLFKADKVDFILSVVIEPNWSIITHGDGDESECSLQVYSHRSQKTARRKNIDCY